MKISNFEYDFIFRIGMICRKLDSYSNLDSYIECNKNDISIFYKPREKSSLQELVAYKSLVLPISKVKNYDVEVLCSKIVDTITRDIYEWKN